MAAERENFVMPILPDLKRLILEQAHTIGNSTVEDYLRVVLGADVSRRTQFPLSDAEFESILADLSSDGDLPSLPADFTRADIYSEHDDKKLE